MTWQSSGWMSHNSNPLATETLLPQGLSRGLWKPQECETTGRIIRPVSLLAWHMPAETTWRWHPSNNAIVTQNGEIHGIILNFRPLNSANAICSIAIE